MNTLDSFNLDDTEQSVSARFEEQVRLHGKRIAVVDPAKSWTYEELNRAANRIARSVVLSTGTSPSRVAIFMDKGADYLASILGILKAGHAYVPLDPVFPLARNRYIVDDVSAPLVLTQGHHMSKVRDLVGEAALVVDIDGLAQQPDDDCNLDLPVSPDALAYIIYTSGSTGQPKGVMQNQRNTLHGCMRRSYLQRIVPEDRMTLFYSCSVMGSVYCIFGALLNGAALLAFDIRENGLIDLSTWLVQQRVTVYHSVASVFRQFANQFDGQLLGSSVRLVIFGGERVFVSDIAAARRVFSQQIEFFTGLGSTETGTIRHLMITPQTSLDARLVPIGYPVQGVDVVLKSEAGDVLGEGQIGEIHVRSRYLALGYWNDEEATRRSFSLVDPERGIREYRMGDLAELMPDGRLEHRGRKDHQVKIRGFRVELGEVDAALQSHPMLREATVKAQEVGHEMQLVGYIVRRASALAQPPLSAQGLREYLRERLPAHMVPSAFVDLPALPRTPNGKVATPALPHWLPQNALEEAPPKPASTDTQRALLLICSQVLGRPILGVNSNFFDLGGDSLSATRLLSHIDRTLHVRVTMRDIFSASTLEVLADIVDRTRASAETASARLDGGLVRSAVASAPATAAQRRMWLAEQLNPQSSAYNISNAVRLRGELNRPALEQALNEVVARHGSLRTCFHLAGDELVQTELAHQRFDLPLTAIEDANLSAREAQAMAWLRGHSAQFLDLANGPLFSCHLLRLGSQDHILSLTFNHIVYDNIWSSQVFFRELNEIYAELCRTWRTTDVLPALAHRFIDFALWERQRIDLKQRSEHLAYWRRQLSGLPRSLDLPSDRPRPAQLSACGGQVSFTVPAALRQALLGFNRQQAATSFMSMMAVWQLLLHRYSGQDDLAVGTPTGRRYRPETESMIGLFINNLVMRARFAEGMSFSDLLGQVRQVALDAYEHDELPFEALVAELAPQRDNGSAPLFRHFFIHRNASQVAWKLQGLELEPIPCHHGTSKFDLTLSVLETEDALTATLEYSADLFDRETVERMAGHYVSLLASALAAPFEPVSKLNLLTPAEQSQLIDAPNRTAVNQPVDLGLLGLFRQQVVEQPGVSAVVAHDGTLSYAQLDAASDRLATQLSAQGVRPGVLVGICLQRSVRLPVALLAVLKAGGAYVPLDPDYPAERLVTMLDDSAAAVLVSESDVLGRFGPSVSAQVLRLDELPSAEPLANLEPARHRPSADDLAYVIYTSGSTGKPKGVQVTHGGLLNFLCAMRSQPGLGRGDVLQAVTTVCFDIAALEMFLPLVTGARVVIGPRELSLSPEALQRSLVQHQVTVMQATPVTWRMLLNSGWTGAPGFKVLCGGEAMGADLAERLLATGCEVWNLYGPTETTIWSSAARLSQKDDARFVGEPIANTQLLVTNGSLAVQPLNVPGELVIGGDGVARGYLGRPDLTHERFVDSPLGSTGRLYRTGDLAVRRAGGRIEFLGRADHQIKIRGFRVELGDIEAHLAAHPDVVQAVVMARDDGAGSFWLVGYVVLRDAATRVCTELHDHLKANLPHYMVPSAFVSLAEFPLTPNGKIDRKRLPAPGAGSVMASAAAPDSGPRDDLDRGLLSIFEQILQRPTLGIDSDFFANGGDSMMAIRLIAEIKRSTGLELPLLAVFEAPTIRGLVARIGASAERAATVVRLNGVNSGTPIYCLAGVQLYKALAQRLSRNPVFGVYARRELTCLLAHAEGQQTVVPADELVQNYADAVERHAPQKQIVLAGLSFGGLLALEVATELKRRGFQISQVALFDTTPEAAYQRSPGKAVLDLAKMLLQGQALNVAVDLALRLGRRWSLFRPAALMQVPAAVTKGRPSLQSKAFRALGTSFDLKGKQYALDVLLLKATRKTLGLGVSLKQDYGFKPMITGRLKLAEVDADHLGIIETEALGCVVDHLQTFLEPPLAPVRPVWVEDTAPAVRPIHTASRPALTSFMSTGPGPQVLPPRHF